MSKEDLENLLKFAEDKGLMQEPFDVVYGMWLEQKQR